MATLPGTWRYRVSTGTGRPGVSILWLGEVERLICNVYLSVAARKIVWADPSLRYTSLLLGRWATNQQTIQSGRPHFNTHSLCRAFPRSHHTSDLKTGTQVITLPGAWHCRVSTCTGLAKCRYTVISVGQVSVYCDLGQHLYWFGQVSVYCD